MYKKSIIIIMYFLILLFSLNNSFACNTNYQNEDMKINLEKYDDSNTTKMIINQNYITKNNCKKTYSYKTINNTFTLWKLFDTTFILDDVDYIENNPNHYNPIAYIEHRSDLNDNIYVTDVNNSP